MNRRSLLSVPLMLAATGALATSCETYDPPPRPAILGLESGVLRDPRAPIAIDFGTAIDPGTLRAKVALFQPDVEGNLADEDPDPASELRVLVRRDPVDGDLGARAEIDAAGGRLTLVPESALPVGPKLVLVVEAGLRSASGSVSRRRMRIPFSYVVTCAAPSSPSRFPTGTYFILLDVEKPIGTQLQLLAYLDVDRTTGALISQFTNADRSPTQTCPTPCSSSDVCRLLPAPECVPPSTRAGTVDEWPDFVPNAAPPIGYSFLVQGCTADDVTGSGLLTAPATLAVEQPKVTVEGLTMTSSFVTGPDGVVRATGSLTADVVRLGENPLGPGQGTMTAVKLPDDRAPAALPRPPPADAGAPSSAGGSDGGT